MREKDVCVCVEEETENLLAVIVAASVLAFRVPPPVRVVVAVIEYSSRPVSVYDVLLVEIPLLKSLKHSVLLLLE